MTLTLTKRKKEGKRGPLGFWQRAARFLGAMFGLTYSGFLLGHCITGGLAATLMSMPKVLFGAIVISLVAGLLPLGFYYENHRFRWIYIVIYYLAALAAAFVIGYSIGTTA